MRLPERDRHHFYTCDSRIQMHPWRAKPLAPPSTAVPPRQKLVMSFCLLLNVCLSGPLRASPTSNRPIGFLRKLYCVYCVPARRLRGSLWSTLLSALRWGSRRYEATLTGGQRHAKKLAVVIDWTIIGPVHWVCVSPHTWWTDVGFESQQKYLHQYSKCTECRELCRLSNVMK